MSNKNRRQGNSPRQHDDSDHVISNEQEVVTNDVPDPLSSSDVVNDNDNVTNINNLAVICNDVTSNDTAVAISNNDVSISNSNDATINNNTDVSNSNNTDVFNSNNTDVAISNNNDAVITSNTDVAISNNNDAVITSNADVAISNNTDVTFNNIDAASGAINNDVTTGNVAMKEQLYCKMKRDIELFSIKEKKLLDDLTELQNKYESLEESTSQRISLISSEKEQYKMERDELQRKIDNVTSSSNCQEGAKVSLPLTPHGDTWQPANHSDIEVISR